MTGSRYRVRGSRARLALLLALLLLAAVLPAASPVAAVGPVQDPERTSTAITGWGLHHGVTPTTINNYVAQGNRIIDLEVESATGPTFSVTYVKNSGTYLRGWWWYYGQTISSIKTHLTANNARLIDIEPYYVGTSLRYAVVMVRNTGDAAKAWWWYTGVSPTTIGNLAATNNARPIDIDRYVVNGVTKWTVIFISNTGVDAKAWWHYYSRTPTQIASLLNTNHARLIDIERAGSYYDVIMTGGGSGWWWWYHGQSISALMAKASQNGARIFKVEPYFVGGTKYFAGLMLNNVNAETTRIRELMRVGLAGGVYGVYLKKMGGPTLVNLQKDVVFEPASMIKVVHHLHAMRSIMNTAETLTTSVTWYVNPSDPARYPSDFDYADDKNKCAYADDGTLLTGKTYVDQIGPVILAQMMKQSDNRATDGVVIRYGFAAINATAALVGMSKTALNHRIGCDRDSPPAGWAHNQLTLNDAGLLYEKVENGTLLGTGTYRTKFYEYMAGGPISTTSEIADIIRDEATHLGMSALEADQFIANTKARSKGGSYDSCPDTGACNPPYWYIRTSGGTIWMPYKNLTGTIVPTPYVYGRFVDKLALNCSFKSAAQTDAQYAAACPAWKKASQIGSGLIGLDTPSGPP